MKNLKNKYAFKFYVDPLVTHRKFHFCKLHLFSIKLLLRHFDTNSPKIFGENSKVSKWLHKDLK